MPEILIRKSMKASYVLLGVRASLVTGQGQCRCGGLFTLPAQVTGKQFDCPKAHQRAGGWKKSMSFAGTAGSQELVPLPRNLI
jgi:hypothetical protein